MALKNYKITFDDGTEQYLQLNDDDRKAWQERADDKRSTVRSVTAGTPEPINK